MFCLTSVMTLIITLCEQAVFEKKVSREGMFSTSSL